MDLCLLLALYYTSVPSESNVAAYPRGHCTVRNLSLTLYGWTFYEDIETGRGACIGLRNTLNPAELKLETFEYYSYLYNAAY